MSMSDKFIAVVARLSTPGDGRILLVRPRVFRRAFKLVLLWLYQLCFGYSATPTKLCCTNLLGDNHKN